MVFVPPIFYEMGFYHVRDLCTPDHRIFVEKARMSGPGALVRHTHGGGGYLNLTTAVSATAIHGHHGTEVDKVTKKAGDVGTQCQWTSASGLAATRWSTHAPLCPGSGVCLIERSSTST